MNKDMQLDKLLVIDGHSDIPRHLYLRHKENITNPFYHDHYFPLRKSNVNVVVVNIFTKESDESALKQAMVQLYLIHDVIKNNENVILILDQKDLTNCIETNRIGLILSLEGFEPLAGNVELINIFQKLGVRAGMLTWNNQNCFASGPETNSSLSKKGFDAIKRMNELDILIDVSHLNEEGFWQVISNTDKPVIASHSNARALFNHPRNLSDDQIKAIANTGGFIGLVPYFSKVDPDNPSKARTKDDVSETIDDYIKHIEYIVNLVGYDHVAFGFDFNTYLGDFGVKGIEDTEKIKNVINLLLLKGHHINDVEKISAKNILRVYRSILD